VSFLGTSHLQRYSLLITFYPSFGFAKFKNVHDSEKCIRGFYRLGYEVGFARVSFLELLCPFRPLTHLKESFNARLKAEGDESSTNLYISNLLVISTRT